ncbi:transcriptional Coactivator p15-domain-containing protein [Lactarius vividus]|nr:transcriptional Coactivator p15-domain-containing protein [Lactarius vividus]
MGKLDESKSSGSRKSAEKKSRGASKRKVEDQESSDSGEDAQPSLEAKQRPAKTVKKPKPAPTDDDDSGRDADDARTKLQQNSEGDSYVDLGKKKRATVRNFKGSTLIDIREYYGSEGDEKPGKKGIALSVEQWKSLMQASSAIDSLL